MIDRERCVASVMGAAVRRRRVLCSAAGGAITVLAATLLYFGLRPPTQSFVRAALSQNPPAADISDRWTGWLTDLRSAASAAEDGKDVLVEFAAHQDSPAPLEKLLTDPAFASVRQRYVLVRLDVTTTRSDPATVERTAQWIDKLNLTELPCLVPFDSAFRPFGIVRGNDAASVNDLLSKLHAMDDAKARRDSDLASAAKAFGLDRARYLDRAMDDVGPAAALGYQEVMQEIVRLDPDGAAGLKTRYAARVSDQLVDDRIQHVVYPLVDAGDLRGALDQASQIDRNVATTVAQHQLLRAFQGQLYSSLGEKQKALAMMDLAIALDPSTDAATRVRNEKSKIEQEQ